MKKFLLYIVIITAVSLSLRAAKPVLEEKLKNIIVDAAGASFRGKVSLESIRLTFGTSVTGTLHNFKITYAGENGKETTLLSAGEGFVSLSLSALFRTKNPLESITEIRIVKPEFFLHRRKDGQWNINRILVQKEKVEKKVAIPAFTASALLSGGIIRVMDEFQRNGHRFTLTLADINVKLDAGLFPSAFATLDAKINGAAHLNAVSHLDFENQQFSAHVSLKDQDLASLSSLVSGAAKVSLMSGNSDAEADIHSSFDFKDPQIFGNASFYNVALKTPYVPSPIRNVYGSVSFSRHGIVLNKIQGNLNASPIAVGGKIINLKNPELEIVAAAQNFNAQELQAYLPKNLKSLCGHFDAAIRVSGAAAKPKIAGDISHAVLQMKGASPSRFAGTFSYDAGGKVLLAEATAKINEGDAQLSLIASLNKKPSVALFTNAQNISLQSFSGLLPPSAAGASGIITGQAVALSASPLQASAVMEMNKPAYKETSLDKIIGGVVLSGKDIMVTPVIAVKGTSVAAMDGKISDKNLSMNFHTGKANFQEVLSRKNIPVNGSLIVEGALGGTFTQPEMKASFSTSDLTLAKVRGETPVLLGTLYGDAELVNREIHLPSVQIKRGDSSVSFNGKIMLSTPSPEIYGKVDFYLDKMEQMLDELLPSNPVEYGGGTGHVDIAGPVASPVAKGTISTSAMKIYGEEIPSSQIALSFKKNFLHFETQSTPFGSQTNINGNVDFAKQNFSVEAKTKEMNLSQVAHLAPVYKNFSAIADADLTAGGAFTAPKISGSIHIPDLVIEEETLGDFAANFSWEGKAAQFLASWGTQPSSYKMAANVVLPGSKEPKGHVELSGDIEKGKLFSLLNLFPRTMQNFMLSEIRSNVICNDVSSHFSISSLLYFDPEAHQWVFEKASGQLKTALTGLRAKDESLGNFNADVAFKDNVLTIDELRLKDKDFTIEVQKDPSQQIKSQLDLKGALNLRASVQNLNLRKFAFLFPEAQNLKGTFNTTVILRGSAQNPELIGKASVADFSYLDYAIDTFEGRFKYFDDIFDFGKSENPNIKSGFLIKKGTQSVAVYGKLPYIWSKKEIPRDTPFYLTMEAPDFDLAMLKDVSKTLEGLEKGKLQSTVTIAGTLNQPALSGHMDFSDIEYKNAQSPVPVYVKTMKLTFEKDTVTVDDIQGSTDKNHDGTFNGLFSGKGSLALNLNEPVPESLQSKTTNINKFLAYKFSPKNFDFAFQSKNLLVKMVNFVGKIDSALAFRGNLDAPELNANVTVHHASYALVASEETAPSEPSAFFKKLGLFTKIKFGDETTVSNTMMNIETKGEFSVQKLTGDEQVKILGEISSNKGIMTLYTTTFRIKEALVLFEDPLQNLATLKPTLYAKAETVVEPRQGCRVSVTYVIDMRLDKKSLSDKESQNPLRDPEFNEAACTDKPPGGPLDKQEIFFALGPNFKNPNAGKEIISQLGTNILSKGILGPVESVIAKKLSLSEFHVDRDTANNLKVSLAKSIPFPIGNERLKKLFSEGLKFFYNKTFSQDRNQSFGATLYFKPKKTFSVPVTFEQEQKASSNNTKLNIGVQYKFR